MTISRIRSGKIITGTKIPIDVESGAVIVQAYVWNETNEDWEPYSPQTLGSVEASTTIVSVIAASITPVTLAPPNENRVGITVLNEDGSSRLRFKFGTGVNANSYSNYLDAGEYYESTPPRYTGGMVGYWETAVGRAFVTEFII